MFNLREKISAVTTYIESKSIIVTRRRFRRTFDKNPPSRKSILSWLGKFKDTGSLDRKFRQIEERQNLLLGELLAIQEILNADNRTSIRKIANVLEMSKSKVHRLLKIMKFKAYKIQTFQKIPNVCYEERSHLAETMLDLFRQNPNTKLIMSDEAIFHLNGRVNKHNCRIWADENPRAFSEFERDSPKVTVWCGISATKIYGPFLSEKILFEGITTRTC